MSKLITPVRGLLFELLRSAINGRDIVGEKFPSKISDKMWHECYLLACNQGVMALAWQGIIKLPAELQPPKGVKITWALAVERYEKSYFRYCSTVAELSEFYRENGIETVQMKGVGYSTLYPYQPAREGGDIDIFTYSASQELTDKQANLKADELMQQMGNEVDSSGYKHSNFYYKGIPIENHKNFLNVEHWNLAKRYNPVLRRYLNSQPTKLGDGKYEILTPSPQFNALFISFHAAQHLTSGIKLHHLCDWAVLLNKYGNCLPKEVDDAKYLRWTDSLTYICNTWLGTKGNYLLQQDDMYVELIMKEIFEPEYDFTKVPKEKLGIFVFKIRRFFYGNKIMNNLLGNTIWRAFWHSLVAHLRRPDTILKVDK